MKRVIIVHGWGGNPQEGWFPWLRHALEEKGFSVQVPEMPDTMHPRIDAWVAALSACVGQPDGDLFLVGHSVGCQTILRYLATVDRAIAGTVLVAPWVGLVGLSDDEEWSIAKPWLETPIDVVTVKQHAGKVTMLFSDDDPFVPLENKDTLVAQIGGEATVLHARGHINGEANVTELPEVLNAIA